MTLISFHVTRDEAVVMTDTLAYSYLGDDLGATAKVLLLPHIDAAVMGQGSGVLGTAWDRECLSTSHDFRDFDEFDEWTQERLPELWDDCRRQAEDAGLPHPVDESIVFHVGHSPRHGRMKAYAYTPAADFDPQDYSDDLYAMPAPTSGDPAAPTSEAGWRQLAKRIRRERALIAPNGDPPKVYVGGDVILTRLERDAATSRRIHTFDSTGPEFAQLVARTLHPLYQVSPCKCGSGAPVAVCCWDRGQECICGSGAAIGACHLLDADELVEARERLEAAGVQIPDTLPRPAPLVLPTPTPAPAPSVPKVGRNQPCPCGSGRKHKKCHGASVPA